MTKKKKNSLFKVFDNVRLLAGNNQHKISQKSLFKQSNLTSSTGLGLHISLRLAQYFNGDLELDSEPEKGTNVKISLVVDVHQYSSISSESMSRMSSKTEI